MIEAIKRHLAWRRLRALGPLEREDVWESERYMERRQYDAMPFMMLDKHKNFSGVLFITAGRTIRIPFGRLPRP